VRGGSSCAVYKACSFGSYRPVQGLYLKMLTVSLTYLERSYRLAHVVQCEQLPQRRNRRL
jgi:hypothetical protein